MVPWCITSLSWIIIYGSANVRHHFPDRQAIPSFVWRSVLYSLDPLTHQHGDDTTPIIRIENALALWPSQGSVASTMLVRPGLSKSSTLLFFAASVDRAKASWGGHHDHSFTNVPFTFIQNARMCSEVTNVHERCCLDADDKYPANSIVRPVWRLWASNIQQIRELART